MLRIHSIASSSKGNSHLVITDNGVVIVDAGISCKRVREGLEGIGKTFEDVIGVLITHTHCDHVNGIRLVAKNSRVFIDKGHLSELRYKEVEKNNIEVRKGFCDGFHIEDIHVKPFEVIHDAYPTFGYVLSDHESKVGICTDVGKVTENIVEALGVCNEVLIESNYDVQMLKYGPYDESLKMRIMGDGGHMSNDESAYVCSRLAERGVKKFTLGHLSENNNEARKALETVWEKLKNFDVELCAMWCGRIIKHEK